MKVLITGAFCSGKTTISNDLSERLHVQLIADYCREILEVFPHVDWTIPELRHHLLVRQLVVEKQQCRADAITVIDGGIVSNLAHDRVLLKSIPDRRELIKRMNHDPYDLVFQCDHNEISLVDDGKRFTDAVLRNRVSQEISNVLDMLGYDNRILLLGSREDRFAFASDHILRYKRQ